MNFTKVVETRWNKSVAECSNEELYIALLEMDDVIFPKMIFWQSYIFAVLITVVFGMLVNYSMYKKLKNIPMVESLKSVE